MKPWRLQGWTGHERIEETMLYAHDTFAIGTAVKPIGKEELDVNAACVLSLPLDCTQQDLKLAEWRKTRCGGKRRIHKGICRSYRGATG